MRRNPKATTVDLPDEDWQPVPEPEEGWSWEECRKLADTILDKKRKQRKPLR